MISADRSKETVADLRRQLRERFPEAMRECRPSVQEESVAECFEPEALATGVVSEIVAPPDVAGCGLILARLLEGGRGGLALIDGGDCFDPCALGSESCEAVLWLRCRDAGQALRCADLLLRDANLPLVVLDLSLNEVGELRAIPASSWHRLRQLTRQADLPMLALTPLPLIPNPGMRRFLRRSLTLDDLERLRGEVRPMMGREATARRRVGS